MTVSTQVSRNEYTGNGATTQYDFTFRILDKSHLLVQTLDTSESIVTLTLGTDYTVTGVNRYNGGKVVLTSALPAGYKISIERSTPVTQEASIRNQGGFFPEIHEDALDKLTMLVQQAYGWWSGLSLRKPSWLANYYDALNNRIRNLRDPSQDQDAATKKYTDTLNAAAIGHSDDLFKRTMRVPESAISILPAKDFRKNKIVAMDNNGDPLMVLPESGSAADVLIELAKPTGSIYIGHHEGNTVSEYLDLTKALPHVAPLWQKVRSAQADAYIIILGDSTGNSDFEWVYKWSTWVASKYPTHSVRYRLFVDGSGWDPEIVMSTGTTGRSIYIDNVSVPGSTERYYQGAMRSQIYNSGRTYDLVILNYGHNEGTTVPELTIQAGFTEGVLAVKQDNPGAPVIVTAQNPRRDFPDHSARAVSAWAKVAAVQGLGIIDVYSKFIELGVPESLYTDFIHPNAAGMDVWAGVAIEALNDNPAFQFDKVIETYTGPLRPNLAPNPAFNSWLSSLPVSWAVNSVAVSRDLSRRDSFAFSVKAEVLNTSSPLFYCDLSDYLFAFKGQWVTFAARIWKNSGLSTNAGRLQISGTGMTAVASRTKANEAENGWMWVVCHALLPKTITTLQIRLIPGSTVGEYVHIDRCWFGVGLMPSDIDFINQSQVQLDDYYSPLNVGIPSGYDGTLTVDGRHITVTPATTKARVYINIEYLTVGNNYKVTWVRNNSSTGDVYIRGAASGLGDIITQGELETATSLTFTATNKTNSVLIETDGLTPIDVNISSIVKV
ncbi:TPA: hypothetical protein NEX12_001756 [Klebsiella pneumoniae]|uniref:SGNH/GDSL hydrolase family protein n=1 Tax=Klebsiella pneumoniae TaxID=573 RepID=UPI000CA15E11|nr:SGNH/GDSL hydrolase family protein [Klebsiella pneumoniae]AUB46711.1 Phage tail fiber protein [Klebsiella pneumoniae]MDH8048301.1 phage tail fiber protein [Klebsiella pneumoniae]MDH8058904.1 phage tail fiber protein [Klebsiella pneumoniae]MDH8080973.1 phage tail fiber protein [Klebsiella pneumoniae]MDH8150506.1 phage tail fiber protein [Klebsiella pneumoniae]